MPTKFVSRFKYIAAALATFRQSELKLARKAVDEMQ
jgi:hypothetical protein